MAEQPLTTLPTDVFMGALNLQDLYVPFFALED
jgi:hypothetical protein